MKISTTITPAILFLLGFVTAVPALAQFGASVAISNNRVVVGEPNNARVQDEAAFIFEFNATTKEWTRSARISNSPASLSSNFGYSSAIRDSRAYVSSITERTVTVLENAGGNWVTESTISPTALLAEAGATWGSALASGDDLVVVGHRSAMNNAGAAYVYRRNGQVWEEEAILQASDGEPVSTFARSIAWNGEFLLVGSDLKVYDGVRTGAVYIFRHSGTEWVEEAILTPGRRDESCRLGKSVAVSGNLALASAQYCGGGSVYFLAYDSDLDEWAVSDSMSASSDPEIDGIEVGLAGNFLAIEGGYAAVPVHSPTDGDVVAVYEHNPVDGSWSKSRTIVFDEPLNIRSVSMDGDRIIVGGVGTAVVYERNAGTGDWNLIGELSGTDAPVPITGALVPCAAGQADIFQCENVDLLSYLPNELINDPDVHTISDLWGWSDPETGQEYALVGQYSSTVFVDVTDGSNPIVRGHLPMTDGAHGSSWRDIKVYDHYAFVVSDAAGQHGMQVFDLQKLRAAGKNAQTFTEDVIYTGIASAHNVAINAETGFAYIVGAGGGGETCGGGLHMVDIHDPLNPVFAGCFSDANTGRSGTGYTHDVQCVIYDGPDADHTGKEICLGSNETAFSIADVTDKMNPVDLSSADYPTVAYSHQGWLTEDHRFFLMNDELDELDYGNNSRTIIWDVEDLDDPVVLTEYFGPSHATTHNLYINRGYAFLSNYAEGLRILDVSDVLNPQQVAFFDTVPPGDDTGFNGAWSSYPFFPSGNVIISSRSQGLFVVRPTSIAVATEEIELPSDFTLSQNYPNPFNPTTMISFTLPQQSEITLSIVDVLGREIRVLETGVRPAGTHSIEFDASNLSSGTYFYRLKAGDEVKTRSMTVVK